MLFASFNSLSFSQPDMRWLFNFLLSSLFTSHSVRCIKTCVIVSEFDWEQTKKLLIRNIRMHASQQHFFKKHEEFFNCFSHWMKCCQFWLINGIWCDDAITNCLKMKDRKVNQVKYISKNFFVCGDNKQKFQNNGRKTLV